jgi:hypothetical protein
MQPVSKIIAVVLLGTMVGAAAGMVCWLPASATASHSAGCHPVRVPSNPQSADYRCCANRHPSALTTGIFSPQPGPHLRGAAVYTHVSAAAIGDAILPAFAPASGPPDLLILRI